MTETTKRELLKECSGYMAFNKQVATLLKHKTMTRRVVKKTNHNKFVAGALYYSKEPTIEARYFYKIKSVKLERLQDISDDDCIKEGIYEFISNDKLIGINTEYCIEKPRMTHGVMLTERYGSQYEAFEDLWNSTATKGTDWDSNPLVWVIEYESIDNIEKEIR